MKRKNILLGGLALLLLALVYRRIGCPIRFLTGISCLGCGMTRAWTRVLRLDFSGAFAYHPAWPIPLLFIGVYRWVRPVSRRAYNVFLYVAAGIFVLTYAVRVWLHSPVVVFDPRSGFLYRVLAFFLGSSQEPNYGCQLQDAMV